MRAEEYIHKEVKLLKEVPLLIEAAKGVYDNLPEKHKGRNEIVRQVNRLRKDLIRLDVLCQDLDWGIMQRKIQEQYKDDYGIESFSVVHDSFGTHACDIEQLGIVLRETFVNIYEKDILKKFMEEQGDLDLPDLPEYGKLNIEEVKDAEFFFS